MDKDTTKNTVSGGTELVSGVLAPGETLKLDLDTLRIRIPPGTEICLAANVSSGAAADISGSLVWYEDIS
jgi:hypothetical protein